MSDKSSEELALDACHALGIEPADLEAKVRALMEAVDELIGCFEGRIGGDYFLNTEARAVAWTKLRAARVPFARLGGKEE